MKEIDYRFLEVVKYLENNKLVIYKTELAQELNYKLQAFNEILKGRSSVDKYTLQIVVPGINNAEAALPVYGDSMHPEYKSGDIILVSQLRDLHQLVFGKVYLVITDEQRVLKKVMRGTGKDTIRLVLLNEEYQPYDVHLFKVLSFHHVLGMVRKKRDVMS